MKPALEMRDGKMYHVYVTKPDGTSVKLCDQVDTSLDIEHDDIRKVINEIKEKMHSSHKVCDECFNLSMIIFEK